MKNGHTTSIHPRPALRIASASEAGAPAAGGFRIPRRARGWVLPALGLLAWWALYRFGDPGDSLLVAPGKVVESGLALVRDGHLVPALASSLARLAIGFALGTSLGLLLGAAFGMSRTVERLLGPTLHAVKQVSLFAWIPLIAMWLGLGEAPKIAVLAWAAFFPVLLNTFEGVRGVQREHLEVARALAFSRRQVLLEVVLPSALPSIFTGISLALLYAWLATLGAEYLLTSGRGIGTLLVEGREHAFVDQVLFCVVVVGAVGLLLNALAARIEARLLRWRGETAGRY